MASFTLSASRIYRDAPAFFRFVSPRRFGLAVIVLV
jgi:hypothetical protein